MVVRKNDVIMDDGHCLTGSYLINAFRGCKIAHAYRFKNGITRQTMTMGFAAQMGRGEEDLGFGENSPAHRMCKKLIGSYKMNLTKNTRWGMQIHMIIRGELRRKESTAAMGKEASLVENTREIIGIIKEWLIALLVKEWNTNTTVGIITMEIGGNSDYQGGHPLRHVNFAENENSFPN